MPITNNEAWEESVKANTEDDYGVAIVKAAREAMRLLDTEAFHKPLDKDSAHEVIMTANKAVGGGMSGFQAGCVAATISQCHSRGEEFTKAWNDRYRKHMRNPEDDSGVVNPAMWSVG